MYISSKVQSKARKMQSAKVQKGVKNVLGLHISIANKTRAKKKMNTSYYQSQKPMGVSSDSTSSTLQLNDYVCKSLQMGRVFRDNTKEINSIDFSDDGKYLVTGSDDESIHLYDCLEGNMVQKVFSNKYGVDNIVFTHENESVLYASNNKFDDSIRYLSLHDNQYIRYFKGHRARVVSLCMSPVDDTFISGSVDNTVMFWDLRSPNAQGKIDVRGSPAVAYDPKGLCFAVASAINLIKMYDKRRFDQGPFAQFPIKSQSTLEFLNIKFSPGGQYISAMTNESLLLIDAYKGDKVAEFTDFCNETLLNLEASFTPDEQYLISGSENGIIHIWDSKSRFEKVTELKGHAGPVRCVKFNPYYAMLASACTNLAFWIPVSSTSMRQ